MDRYQADIHQVEFPTKVCSQHKDDKFPECVHWDESSSLPPSYESIFGQFKDTKGENASSLDYLKKTLGMFIGTIGCTFSLTLLLALPMAMIVIGVKYKDECPVEPFISVYLIVGGSFGILKTTVEIIRRLLYNGDVFSSEEKQDSQAEDRSIGWMFFDGILSLFLFSWFIAGNIWIYSKYKPNFVAPHHQPLNYCNKTLYLFSFWVVTGSYLIMIVICFCTCCLGLCAGCTAFFVTSANNRNSQQNGQQ